MSQENSHLTRLTEDLLVLARARRGVLPVRLVDTSLADLLADARQRAEMMAGAHARVSFAATDARVRVDPVWFRQAIGNLIDNAVQHTPPDGEIAVRADHRDGMLLLTVDDSGPGFPEAFLDGAFGPGARSAAGHERARQRDEGQVDVVALSRFHRRLRMRPDAKIGTIKARPAKPSSNSGTTMLGGTTRVSATPAVPS